MLRDNYPLKMFLLRRLAQSRTKAFTYNLSSNKVTLIFHIISIHLRQAYHDIVG